MNFKKVKKKKSLNRKRRKKRSGHVSKVI